jgi:hypothetical protein
MKREGESKQEPVPMSIIPVVSVAPRSIPWTAAPGEEGRAVGEGEDGRKICQREREKERMTAPERRRTMYYRNNGGKWCQRDRSDIQGGGGG